jgi:hypothetical protein
MITYKKAPSPTDIREILDLQEINFKSSLMCHGL